MEVLLVSKPSAGSLSVCEAGAAMCTNSKTPARALRGAVASGHDSVLEHAVYTFEIRGISRVTLAQLTRHRIASYSVMSQRYVNQMGMKVVVPPSVATNTPGKDIFENTARNLFKIYNDLIAAGVPQEDARYMLPQGIETDLLVTMNARELGHFFALRCCNRAQWEIRELADKMLAICKEDCPEIFHDAGPSCMRDGCHEKRPCGHPRSAERKLEV